MRLSREDYRKAEECLYNYKYNCRAIHTLPQEVISLSPGFNVGSSRAPYSISDPVFNNFVKLQEDDELQKVILQYNAVENVKDLLTEEEAEILDNHYLKRKTRFAVANQLHLSERTFARRKKTLIYKVDREIKKLARNWHNFGKTSQN